MGYTSQQFTVIDTSTYANFAALGSVISAQILAMGWAQTADTGQAVWGASLIAITAALRSGSNTTYTYTLTSGPALAINTQLAITAMGHAGNNGTFAITALGGGTFTVVNGSGVTATESGAGNSAAASIGNGIYEIWAPTDALQTGATKFFLKIFYGTGASNGYLIGIQLATSTDGAGGMTGAFSTVRTVTIATQNTFVAESDFSGDTGRLGMIISRSGTAGTVVAVERTLNRSGVPGADALGAYGVTLFTVGGFQTTVIFGTGVALEQGFLTTLPVGATTELFNGTIAISPAFPVYGRFGNPHTVLGAAAPNDATEGLLLQASLYGSTRAYIATKKGSFVANGQFLLFRYD